MRQVVLDTETTGLNARSGDRIIEIGCVELFNRRITGKQLHHYVNPERKSDSDALRVHGIQDEFLLDKPKFAELAEEIMGFCAGAEIIIHNAAFDLGFLNAELERSGHKNFTELVLSVIDTLDMSRQLTPGKRHNLDSLCERYGVNNKHRTLHGALLDAQLLAEVYLGMTRGQESLLVEASTAQHEPQKIIHHGDQHLTVLCASEEELNAHEQYLDRLEKQTKTPSRWRQLLSAEPKAVAINPLSAGEKSVNHSPSL